MSERPRPNRVVLMTMFLFFWSFSCTAVNARNLHRPGSVQQVNSMQVGEPESAVLDLEQTWDKDAGRPASLSLRELVYDDERLRRFFPGGRRIPRAPPTVHECVDDAPEPSGSRPISILGNSGSTFAP